MERGLLGLDEPLTRILPEFEAMQVLTGVSDGEFVYQPAHTPITARHLLSHTSGLGYRFTNPLLGSWADVRDEKHGKPSLRITDRYKIPLVFNPGTDWLYGCGLDWAGVVISRLNGGIQLGEYFVRNIWKPLGLREPFPTFNITLHAEYLARAMGGASRVDDGSLIPNDTWTFDNPADQDGGVGLAATANDYLTVLADLVADSPKLLARATVDDMFTPQLHPDSEAIRNLLNLRPAWDIVAGTIQADAVNHGLGGMLCLKDVPEIGQPGGMLAWGGASNIVWWANREAKLAGFFATQQVPFGNETVTRLVNEWKRDFWGRFHAGRI